MYIVKWNVILIYLYKSK